MSVEHVPREVGELVAFDRSTREHQVKHRVVTTGEEENDVDRIEFVDEATLLRQNLFTFGGVVADGCRAWIINGRSLKIVSTLDGGHHSMWEFGRHSGRSAPATTYVEINCAVQIHSEPTENEFELVMGADDGQSGGLVCVFDPSRNGISKAIGMPHSVTAVEAVSGLRDPTDNMVAGHLRYKNSLVAVGTRDGAIYLVDLQLDERRVRGDECDAGRLVFVDPNSAGDVPRIREGCLGQNRFLAHFLNSDCLVRDVFQYYSANDSNVEMSFSSGDVHVSSLRFLRQAGLLAVGFSFGGFQLWNLNTLTLEYACPCEDRPSLSVVSFAFQEPDNDPRDDCYLWVVRGHATGDDLVPEDVTNATLYCLTFCRRTWTDGFGFCYKELSSCLPRFDWGLTLEPSLRRGDEGILGSRLIHCSMVEENPVSSCRRFQESGSGANCSSPSDRENGGKSLCLFVWETFFVDSSQRPTIVLAVFDLNQWYQTQMPSVLRCNGIHPCPYFGFFSMTEICKRARQGSLLSIDILVRTISRPFALYPSEKLSYPSFLSFGVVAVFTTGVVQASFPGLQGQAFDELMRGGTLGLVDPERALFMLRYADLLPLHGEPFMPVLSQTVQRENIMSMALEQNLIEFLRMCIRDWSTGRNVTNTCNLRFFQEWAWKRVAFIKKYIDIQCPILYDCSGLRLEASIVNCLHARVAQLKHLEKLLRRVVECCSAITEQGSKELTLKANVTLLLAMHTDVVLWFLNFGLLPENHETDVADGDNLIYPRNALSRSYDELRAESQKINSGIGPTDFLLIDGIVSNVGDQISALWEKEELEASVETGNAQRRTKRGLYPPPTLHALLSIFLLDGVSSSTKHRIVQYFFFDLAMLLNGGPHARIVDDLVMYPARYGLSPSLTKLTQGFWLLDHKNFEEALSVLLHPIIEANDISPWQHRRIMKAFLYQGEAQKALRYAHVRQPPHDVSDDRKFHLTLLIAGGNVTEAFFYQREIRNESNAEDILNHFFLGCLQTNCFRDILQLPFCSFEEKCLEGFLLKSPEKKCRDYLVVYFMIRSKYVEAKRLNDQLAYSEKLETDPAAKERVATRKMFVDGFYNLLPKVQTEIYESACSVFAPGRPVQPVVRSCRPLSTIVHLNAAEPSTRSTFVLQVMECVSNLWNRPSTDYTNTPMRSMARNGRLSLENIPFVGTPLLSRVGRTPRLPNVVYPRLVERFIDHDRNDDENIFVGSPSKKPRTIDVDSPTQDSTNADRQVGAKRWDVEPLSLLQTPLVQRKMPSMRLATPSLIDTPPQSILKWRSNASSPVSTLKRRHTGVLAEVAEKQATPSATTATCRPPLATPEVIADSQQDTSFTGTDSEADELSTPGRGPVRQLRFESADAHDDDNINQADDYNDDDDDTVAFPGSDVPSVTSESVLSDDGRSPLVKSSLRSFSDLLPLLRRTIIDVNTCADDGESTDDSCGDEEYKDKISDDGGQQYVTPEDSSSEVSTITDTPLVSALSSPTFTGNLSSSIQAIGRSPVIDATEFQKSTVKTTNVVVDISTLETKTSTTKLNKPSISDLKGLTPGDLFKKFVEYRSKMLEEDLAADEGTEGPPSLKSLVDTTVESLLATPSTHDEGPVFVSGVYKCDFPSRRSAAAKSPWNDDDVSKLQPPYTEEVHVPSPSLSRDADQQHAEEASTLAILTPSPTIKISQGKLSELNIELDKLDKTFVAEQASPSSVTSTTSSRRSTRSSTAMSSQASESTGMQFRSRHTSTASSVSPESVKQTDTRRRSTRSSSKARDDGSESSTPTTNRPTSAVKSGRRSSLRGKTASKQSERTSPRRSTINKFSFSHPILADDEDAAELARSSSPLCTAELFIFSPPLTRSRSRLSPGTAPTSPARTTVTKKKRKTPSRRSSGSLAPIVDDSTILLSPIVESDDDDRKAALEHRPQHSMTLRRSKAIIKSRRSSSLT